MRTLKYYRKKSFKKLCKNPIAGIFIKNESSQIYCFQFSKMNSLMAGTIKNQFSKTKFL